jgi:hypothetical protein
MLEKWKISTHAETDPCSQLADGFLIQAEKELSAFVGAVDKLFGAELPSAFSFPLNRMIASPTASHSLLDRIALNLHFETSSVSVRVIN